MKKKFKVGDKVRVVQPGSRRPIWESYVSELFPEYRKHWKNDSNTILSCIKLYTFLGKTDTCSLIQDPDTNEVFIITSTGIEFVEPKQFQKSDLKDNHIVVTRNGDKEAWASGSYSYDENLINIGLNCSEEHDIIEIYEFDKLVWKREEKPVEILDEVEKKWLKHFIKSTNIKVRYIKKWLGASCENEYLQLFYDEFNYEVGQYKQSGLFFPIFKKGTMYKGMELNKEYTLKELGLED